SPRGPYADGARASSRSTARVELCECFARTSKSYSATVDASARTPHPNCWRIDGFRLTWPRTSSDDRRGGDDGSDLRETTEAVVQVEGERQGEEQADAVLRGR